MDTPPLINESEQSHNESHDLVKAQNGCNKQNRFYRTNAEKSSVYESVKND